jgi:hypothetical protein
MIVQMEPYPISPGCLARFAHESRMQGRRI